MFQSSNESEDEKVFGNLTCGASMYEESNFHRLSALENQTPSLINQFASLLKVKDFIQSYYPTGSLKTVEISKIDDYTIEATTFNTTVQFQLLMSYGKHDRPSGRVICLSKQTSLGKTDFDYLGEFSFDTNGYTNLPEHPNRGIRTIGGNGDEIVIAFLDKAIEQGPDWLAKAVQKSASLQP